MKTICNSLFLSGTAALALSTANAAECPACEAWNLPHAPFRIHGDTYYVGTEGLSAILVTSEAGHVLLDGGLPESAYQIAVNIETLGFRIEDVRLILNSHVHFDHAGGIAELQRLSGAVVAASPWSEEVLRSGVNGVGDPQASLGQEIEPVANARVVEDGETLVLGPLAFTPHFTPGHTPGGTSWSWVSCEETCVDIVYADSLSPVSDDGYRFTARPGSTEDFEESFAVLESIDCDILLTPHPGFADLFVKAERSGTDSGNNPFVDQNACGEYSSIMRAWLARRVLEEGAVTRE